MAITVEEKLLGREKTPKSAKRVYVIKGASDDNDALTALLENAPSVLNGLNRLNADVSVEEVDTDKGIWYGSVPYTSPEAGPLVANTFKITFDISGTATRLRQSIQTRGSYTRDGAPIRSFLGAINVSKDGTVDGVDVIFPALTYTVTYTFENSQISNRYVLDLGRTVGKTNAFHFQGFDEGELLLTKASGQKREDTNWDIAFSFAVTETKRNFKVGETLQSTGSTITVAEKKGWDYMWVYYEEVLSGNLTDAGVPAIVTIPANVFVEQIYETADYSILNINSALE